MRPKAYSPVFLFLSFSFFLIAAELNLAQLASGQGLKAEITRVKIPRNRRPVVTFKIHDSKGKPLTIKDLDRRGIRFTIATVKVDRNGKTRYHNYVLQKVRGKDYVYKGERKKPVLAVTLQPDRDRRGKFVKQGKGIYDYTFRKALPTDFDKNATHVVGGTLTRGKRKYVVNPLYEFVPSGGKVSVRRGTVETATCNRCHDRLALHGGQRRETAYCVLCHTSQLADPETGENLDFKFMVHKIHSGKNLTSVEDGKPYYVVGHRQGVHDYSTVGFPQLLTNCQACHTGSQASAWKESPSAVACMGCHDDVDLATGKNHAAGPAAEGSCVGCHQPDGPEFGPSVAGAHLFPGDSKTLPGIVFDILKVDSVKPGQNPVVTFSAKNKKGEAVDASKLNQLRLVLAWPTIDYRVAIEEDVRKAEPTGIGVYVHQFKYTIPSDAKGSGAVGIQGYKYYTLEKPNGEEIKRVRDVGPNIVKYFAITDKKAVPRRTVVKTQSCNVCHGTLALHGGSRRSLEYCVFCHNASGTDKEKRVKAKGPMPPMNIHFKDMIKRLHTGEELGEPLVYYGGSPRRPGPIDFSHVKFPGDWRNCEKCHEKNTFHLPLPKGVLPTLVPQADGSTVAIAPITAACFACHNKEPAMAHMATQTAAGKESCVVCHATGRGFAVEKAHAR